MPRAGVRAFISSRMSVTLAPAVLRTFSTSALNRAATSVSGLADRRQKGGIWLLGVAWLRDVWAVLRRPQGVAAVRGKLALCRVRGGGPVRLWAATPSART